MTFYEWIRRSLVSDAIKHPFPTICRQQLQKLILIIRGEGQPAAPAQKDIDSGTSR